MADLSVLICTEGTYPFAGGGVSVWCNVLAQSLPQVEYTVLAVMGDPNMSLRFNLPPNVRRIIHVPLWGTHEPAEYILCPFSC